MNRVQNLVCNQTVQALVMSVGSNIRYATNYLADTACLVVAQDKSYYLTDSRFLLEAKLSLSEEYIIVDTNRRNPYAVARELLGDNIAVIGTDIADITYSEYLAMIDAFKDIKIIDISDDILAKRAVKEDDELKNIVRAQRIAERSLQELKQYIQLGVTEREISAQLEYLMKVNGSSGYAFETIVAFGENSALPHAKPSNRRLANGDIILIDFGATYNGYRSDMTRTFVYGECSPLIKEIYEIVLESSIATINGIEIGMQCVDVDRLARDVIAKHGYEDKYIHSTGHGVGIDIHEEPYAGTKSRVCNTLLENMVLTVEPGIYIEGVGGVRIEDMIVVKGGKALNLTTSDKKLEIINI